TGGLDNGGHSAMTTNSTDAFNLFKFAADNSNVEWSLSGFNNSEEGTNFVFNTTHEKTRISNKNRFGSERSDLIFDVHSHPGSEQYTKIASGYTDGLNYEIGTDMGTMAIYYNAAKAAGKSFPNEYPRFYIYHKETGGLYNYNYQTTSSYVGRVSTPISLRTLINRHQVK
ncbi:MAG: hypothetical protein LBG15_11535, partial [Dysgonamonadaceae bacterium]|nr:hypothetical protein [Dysgonamonadaceae bacterium]